MLLSGDYKGVILQSQIEPDEFLNGSFVKRIYKNFWTKKRFLQNDFVDFLFAVGIFAFAFDFHGKQFELFRPIAYVIDFRHPKFNKKQRPYDGENAVAEVFVPLRTENRIGWLLILNNFLKLQI